MGNPEPIACAPTVQAKRCPRCKLTRPASEFNPEPRRAGGLRAYCRSCQSIMAKGYHAGRREKILAGFRERNYGVTPQEYDRLLVAQRGAARGGGTKKLSIDHDHTTGAVRGLLCQRCNHGLGGLRDRVDLMLAAIEYLRAHARER